MISKIKNGIITCMYRLIFFKKFSNRDFLCNGKLRINGNKINNGRNVIFCDNVRIINHGTLTIGNNVKFCDNVTIYCSNNVKIDDDTVFAANCYLIDCNHSIKKGELIKNQPLSKGSVHIGKDCWLAEDVTVLKDAELGNGCVVGAKALVNKKFSENKIIAGVPAKEIGERK